MMAICSRFCSPELVNLLINKHTEKYIIKPSILLNTIPLTRIRTRMTNLSMLCQIKLLLKTLNLKPWITKETNEVDKLFRKYCVRKNKT